MTTLQIGNVVYQRNEKTLMCVHTIEGDNVLCQWFEGRTMRSGWFRRDALISKAERMTLQ